MGNRKVRYIGHTLKRRRMLMLLTQQELAFESGLTTRSIHLLENNKQEPLLSTICSLALALDMDPSELMKEIERDIHHVWTLKQTSNGHEES